MKARLMVYILILLEAILVALIEIVGGKYLGYTFGEGVMVWGATITLTMMCLAVGYFFSTFRVFHVLPYRSTIWIILLVSIFFVALGVQAQTTLNGIYHQYESFYGVIIAYLMTFALPTVLLGTIPQLLIKALEVEKGVAFQAGRIYALSSFFTLLSILFIGFYALPKANSLNTIWGVSLVVMAVILGMILWDRYFKLLFLWGIVFAFVLVKQQSISKTHQQSDFLYHNTNVLGNLAVKDYEIGDIPVRTSFFNGIPQTSVVNNEEKYSLWFFPHCFSMVLSNFPKESNVLLLGYGGGSVAKELLQLGHQVDAVDIDDRFQYISTQYFDVPTSNRLNITIDDARHYVKTCTKKYDAVVIDLLNGEVQPNHVFTKEGFEDLKKVLKENSLLLINFQSLKGVWKPYMSIFKTLEYSGFTTYVWKRGTGDFQDIIYISSAKNFNPENFTYTQVNECCKKLEESRVFVNDPNFIHINNVNEDQFKEARILTDNDFYLEVENRKTINYWRKQSILLNEK